MKEFTLAELGRFGVCRVIGIEDCEIKKRLECIGISRGAELIWLFDAPCGDPAAYSVRGTTIALRRSDAERITVCGSGEWV